MVMLDVNQNSTTTIHYTDKLGMHQKQFEQIPFYNGKLQLQIDNRTGRIINWREVKNIL